MHAKAFPAANGRAGGKRTSKVLGADPTNAPGHGSGDFLPASCQAGVRALGSRCGLDAIGNRPRGPRPLTAERSDPGGRDDAFEAGSDDYYQEAPR
jgi:hypothetical protein